MKKNYHEKTKQKNLIRLREILSTLPDFCFEYFMGIENITSSKTRIAYAYDLRIFFSYICDYVLKNKDVISITLKDIEGLKPEDIERYSEYLNYYKTYDKENDKYVEHQNDERGKLRKLSSVRSMFNYFHKKRKISKNPSRLINLPKIHDKNIVRLDPDEVATMLDVIESGDGLTKTQKRYHKHTKKRDLALVSLLLGTGIRVSECVGLDINDIDFKNNGIKIVRKGGNESVVYFSNEVRNTIIKYLDERESKKIDSNALFISLQDNRMSVRSVQKMVKKYASLVTNVKKITPHKLRSTYGTNLYRETGDIYLVADVLGHKDVNTTRKHYAEITDDIRRKAANAVTLRKDED